MSATLDCWAPHGRRGLAAEPRPGKYEAAFRDNEIDETVLPDLTAEDLKELGVTALGHRRKLLAAIAALSNDASGQITPRAWAEWDRLYEVRQRMQRLSAREA